MHNFHTVGTFFTLIIASARDRTESTEAYCLTIDLPELQLKNIAIANWQGIVIHMLAIATTRLSFDVTAFHIPIV